MKKSLLIGAAILIGVAGYAQNSRNAANHNNKTLNKGLNKIENEATSTAGTSRVKGASTSAVCIPEYVTSGPNSFGVGGGTTTFQQNCLSYNKDLNSYVITHRRSQEWLFNGRTSGAMQSTWLNVTTGVWDSTLIYRDSTNSAGGRYPSGVIYNPAANTNIANAWVVGTGPALPGGGFNGPWYATRKLTGTTADQTVLPANAVQNVHYGVSPSSPFGTAIFMNVDMQQVGTSVMVTGECTDTTTSGNANHNLAMGVNIAKCNFVTGSPVWSKDSVMPGFYFKRDGSGNGYASSYGDGARMAFGPSGNVGYLVFFGRLANTCNNSSDSMMSPIVYKTINGGATWAASSLMGYDWANSHPELNKNVGTLRSAPTKHFTPYVQHGIDVTVDANDVLHLVTTFTDPYMDGAFVDSLIFNYTYSWDYINYHPIMWDLMTDGSSSYGWKTMMIDSILTAYVGGDPASDTTAAFNAVDNGATFLPYGARLQVSRSTDGTKIFYSWADSDPLSTGTPYNNQPDLWMKAYDVTGNKASISSNITNGIATCFFHMQADLAYFDAGSSKWVAPAMYTLPRTQTSPGVYTGTAPADHIYENCGQYAIADFLNTPTINAGSAGNACAIGIKTNTNNFVNSVSNYPNPFNHTTNIVVNLNEGKSINVSVFDAIGKLVSVKNVNGNIGANTIVFDAANLNAGVYYYTVTAGYEKVTKKMVIQK